MLDYSDSWTFAVMIHEQIDNLMSSIVAYIAERLKNSENEDYSMRDQKAKLKGMRRVGDISI